MLRCAIFLSDFCRFLFKEECRVYSVVSIIVVGQIVSAKFGGNEIFIYFCSVEELIFSDMTTFTLDNSNWIMRLLSPLSDEAKLSIINRLSASLLTKGKRKDDDRFFAEISGAWDDGVSVEDATAAIRESRNSGKTRVLEDF